MRMYRIASMVVGAAVFAGAAMVVRSSLATQAAQPAAPPSTPPPLAGPTLPVMTTPYVWWTGPDSAINETSAYRLTMDADWIAMWRKHAGNAVTAGLDGAPNTPHIDFSRCMIVAFFDGTDDNISGLEMRETLQSADMVRLRFMRTRVAPAAGAPPRKTTAYGIFVIPRTARKILLEEAIPVGDGTFDYVSRVTFPALTQ
jgi:hypothetical protein